MSLREAKELQDAGQRIHDTVTLHILANPDRMAVVGKWCAFRLDDGRSDNTLYDTKDDAVRAQKGRSKDHCYLKITPDGITAHEAGRFLMINRHPLIDTTAPEEVINPKIFPRFSNLSTGQRAELKARAEREFRERNK